MVTSKSSPARAEAIRQALPVTRHAAYPNTGTCGPLPEATAAAIERELGRELREGPSGMAGFLAFRDMQDAMRPVLARVLGCGAAEVALTHHTTEGMNFALHGITWRPGDEVVTSSVEHIGGLGPLYVLAERFGVHVVIADCAPTGERALEAVSAALTERTRAVVLSHVAYSTGYVLPVAEIAERAHAVGALVIVDGAQAAGAIPLDVQALGVDAYAAPGQKWLCGPEGAGTLYISARAIDSFGPSFVGGFSFESFDELGAYQFRADARRFETGSVFRPAVYGLDASVRWITDEVTLPWAFERIVELAAYCRRALEAIDGVTITTPPGRQAGLICFTFPDWEPEAVVEELADRNIVVRSIGRPAGLRVSTGFYNTEEEIDRLAAVLRELQGQEPRAPRVRFH